MSQEYKYLLSIIIPVFNTEDLLPICLNSLLKQNDNCFEIIIVNDGSTGNCENIVREFMLEHDNINYIEKDNGGLSSARNLGIANAKGEYCSFIDSDDYASENYINILRANIENSPKKVDIIIFGLRKIGKENNLLEMLCPTKLEFVDGETAIKKLFEMREYRFHAVTKVVKTELLKDKMLFPLGIYYEDVATTYKWLLKTNNILLIPEILYNYVENDNSITKKPFTNKQFELWENAISIQKEIVLNDEQMLLYTKFLIRTYVDICRLLSNQNSSLQKKYIKLMKGDTKTLNLMSVLISLTNKDRYLWAFLLAYYFPTLFFNIYKLIK